MRAGLQGTVVASAAAHEIVTTYSGSIEIGTSVSARVSIVPIALPTDAFDFELQLEQGLDNLAFVSIGPAIKVNDATPVQKQFDGIGGRIIRARITLDATEATSDISMVFALEVSAVPNPKDPVPTPSVPAFVAPNLDALGPLYFSWRFALAASEGRLTVVGSPSTEPAAQPPL